MSDLEERLARDAKIRRTIEDYITEHAGEHPTARQVAVRFRVPEAHVTVIMDLMTGTAVPGVPRREPDVLTPPAEVLDILVSAVAGQSLADYRTGNCLRRCQMCRNRLLYLLDTAPYAGDSLTASQAILARLRAMPDNHELHQPGSADAAPPRIRWITP